MRKNNQYSAEFKIRIVKSILSGEDSIRGSAKRHGIEHSVIRKWVNHYKAYGEEYLLSEQRGRHQKPKINEVDLDSMTLEEQVHYLKMENAILKKAKALGLIK